MTLDGADDHVQVPFADSLAVDAADFTVMTWVKYRATTGNRPIFWAYGVGDDRSQMWLRAEPGSNRIHGRIQSGSNGGSVTSGRAYNDGAWHHVAFQHHVAVVRGRRAHRHRRRSGRPFQMDIGQRIDGAQHFAGSLDEVRLYRRALTDTEIGRIHATNAVDVAGAVSRLRFHPNFKTTDDASANDNDGVVRQAVPGPGEFGNAMIFDGVDDRVHIPYSNATNLGSSQFTITTWFRYSGGTARQTLLWGYGINEAASQLWVRADPAGDTITASARTSGGVVRVDTGDAYADNAWHFTDGVRGIHLGEKPDGTGTFTGALDEMRTGNTTPTGGLALHLPLNSTSNPAT